MLEALVFECFQKNRREARIVVPGITRSILYRPKLSGGVSAQALFFILGRASLTYLPKLRFWLGFRAWVPSPCLQDYELGPV